MESSELLVYVRVSRATGESSISLSLDEETHIQFSVEVAKTIIERLTLAIEVADLNTFIHKMLKETSGMKDEEIAKFLHDESVEKSVLN